MSYKTILVHVDASRHAEHRIATAAALAIAHDAHLVGTALNGVSRYALMDGGLGLDAGVLAAAVDALNAEAERALTVFERIAAGAGVLSFERRMVADDPAGGLALQARYADLVVLSQTDPDDASARVISDVPEYVMLNGGRPVLLVPYADSVARVGRHVVVAWNASTEAAQAVAAALPLLQRAASVRIAVFNPDDAHGEQPGADIALYLARHGVVCDVVSARVGQDVGAALLSLLADVDADLLVMGGYGHKRLRELVLGGVTKTLLRSMTVPVLMMH
jgi:nucleotide-binding universal stress UspA family protein